MKDVNYLIKVRHPSYQTQTSYAELERGFSQTEWLGLTPFVGDEGRVPNEDPASFVAHFSDNSCPGAIIRRSRFSKENGQWYYIDGTRPLIGRNDPCPCGSGKKFKKCCGQQRCRSACKRYRILLAMHSLQREVLRTIRPDQKDFIMRIANTRYKHELNIVQNNEFVDHHTGRFLMCIELEGIFSDAILLVDLDSALPEGSTRELNPTGRRRVVIPAMKEAYCLGDLLMKTNYGGLDVDIAAAIDNHNTLRPLVERFGVPFEPVNHKGLNREEHDKQMGDAIAAHEPDYVVLAKYMCVLTPEFVVRFPNKIINIHHSFLPALIGARPYHQAYEHDVKITGAIVHYVNDNLDEGPVIAQDVIHVDHAYTTEDTVRAGHDVEKNTLSRALYQIPTQRVSVCGNRMVTL